jgi:hypothetical protein
MAGNKKNVRNPQSELFRRLTRIFSGPMANYRVQTPRKLRRTQLDKYRFKSASGKQFKKSSYNPFEQLSAAIMSNQLRAERYSDFEQMEYTPEIASSLDIYADEMTTSSGLQPLLTIHTNNEEIKAVLEALYHNVLNVEFNLFGWCRTMCKYGDYFLYLDIDEQVGVTSAIGLPTHEVERLEGEDKTNPNYVQFQWNSGGLTFENWQLAHFRVLGNDRYAPYGTSILEPSRRIWRQLTLLEDAMMTYRIVRSPERRVFYVDVGNIAPEDVEQYMQKVMTQMKRNQVVDSSTGRVDLRYNPMSVDEDYFVPVRGGVSTKVETLAGGQYTGDIEDVKYLREKLFSALKVPQSYLAQGEGAQEDKTTLAQKDIRFARTIQRLQRVVIAEMEKIGIIHLYTMGYRSEDLISFKLSLNNPSKIAELQELEHWRTKFEVGGQATEGFFSKRWVSEKIFNMSDDEFLRNQREMFYDRKFEASLEAEAEAAAGGGEEGLAGMGGGLEDEMGGLEGLEGEEGLGGEEPLEEPGDEEAAGALLAAPPGRREDEPTEKSGEEQAHGHTYNSVKKDKDRRRINKIGPRKRHSRRAPRQGDSSVDGARGLWMTDPGLFSVNKIFENMEETQIFNVNQDIESLITELEEKDINKKNVEKNET